EVRVQAMKVVKDWKNDIVDIDLTIGSPGAVKRHQSKISNAIQNVNDLLAGRRVLPHDVLDDAVKTATKALHDAETELDFTNNGIIATDKHDSNYKTIFNSAGIGVSTDGVNTYKNAITGEGVVAERVIAGSFSGKTFTGGTFKGSEFMS